MSKQESSLSYAVRPAVVSKLCGQLSLVLALLTVPPIMVALFCGEFRSASVYAAAAIAFAVIGWTLNRLPRPVSLQVNEAFVLAALAFLLISLAMTFPFVVAGLSPADAFFEATSACTTTGLSTSEQVENKPTSFLFTRAWMQWYGGLGIVVFSIALMVRPGVLAKGLAAPESKEDELLSSTKTHARRVLIVYLVLTCLAVAILWVLSRNLFHAVTYALAAVSTGGFSPHKASLAGFEAAYVAPVAILFGVAGSIPLYLYFRAYASGWRDFVRDSQVPAIGFACLLAAGVFTVLLGVGDDHTNMIASLVGRSLGFPRVITRIEDPELETVCQELGLEDTIIPSLTISRYLADMAQGLNILELSTAIKNEARFFAFVLDDETIHRVANLNLPPEARVVCLYRDGEFRLADEESRIRKRDEVVILTHSKNLRELRERWEPLQLKKPSG